MDQTENNHYLNSIWFIIITFMSIGYGDIVPNTYCGRALAITTGIVVCALRIAAPPVGPAHTQKGFFVGRGCLVGADRCDQSKTGAKSCRKARESIHDRFQVDASTEGGGRIGTPTHLVHTQV